MSNDAFEALSRAIRANDVVQVRAVLERQPGLKARLDEPLPGGDFGATALLTALRFRNQELIEVLLQAGADINARSHWWAGSFGVLDDDHGLAPFLIERGAIVDAHAAARLGMLDRLKTLVGADPKLVHARGGDGQTPLHFASSVEVAGYLLDQGAELDARDVDHESTPAQWMVRDRQAVARYLVSRGCRTDILMAAALGDLTRVRAHLEADPAALRMSVSEQYFPKRNPRSAGTIYQWTLGAEQTAHRIAREFGHEDILQFLLARSPDELQLVVACELGDEAAVRRLLAERPDLAATRSEQDRRKLAHAARDNRLAAVRLMLAAGWPVAVRGQHGATPLHWAAWRGNVEMLKEILRYDPPLELRDQEHDGTPLDWAIHASVHGWNIEDGNYPGSVEALLRAGAQPPKPAGELEAGPGVREVLDRWASTSP